MADEKVTNLGRPKRLASLPRFLSSQVRAKQEIRKKLKKVTNILKKNETERTEDEISTLRQLPDVVKAAEKNAKRQLKQKERVLEIEDQPDELDRKCQELAQMLQSAKNAIVYTGAGISTAASIPDYRGPNGVWTLLKKGQSLRAQDLVDAEPTYTHMCITKLFKEGQVKYLVSQNCDGLHIRSGFPRHSLSEVHGNMFIEICKNCKPHKEYLRLFDVTERTAKGRHKTGRTCIKCGGSLHDTIVHFGEKGGLRSPYKWRQAAKAASKSDLIICLGSSLKVLRCYPCLWRMDMRPEHRPALVIVNLQWTPKDDRSSLKIHGRCDDVLRRVARHLGLSVPQYCRETDPLFRLHTPVKGEEVLISSKKVLEMSHTKPVQQGNSKKKVVRKKTSNSASTHHRVAALKMEHHPGSSSVNHNYQLAPSSTAQRVQSGEMAGGPGDHVLKTEQSNPFSENGHILDPVRFKLEQMLKGRGVGNKGGKVATNGKVRRTERGVRSSQPVSFSPLPSIQDFLPQGAAETTSHLHSHPQLHTLLNILPSLPPALSMSQGHDVFRVDLSTNPISITSTHCSAKPVGTESMHVTPGMAPGEFSDRDGTPTSTSSSSSTSDYAKLIRRIHFDHSYSKNPLKSRSSGKVRNTVRDSLPCSTDPRCLQQVQVSNQCSALSVIPVCSDSSDLDAAHQNMSFILSDQDILSAIQQVMLDLPDNLDLQPGEGHQQQLQHLRTCESNASQERVVINLNSDAGFDFQPSAQPYFSAMQEQQGVSEAVSSAAQPASGAAHDLAEDPAGDDENKDSDSSLENSNFSVRQRGAVSVPGWFGKGLRVRRKRSM